MELFGLFVLFVLTAVIVMEGLGTRFVFANVGNRPPLSRKGFGSA